MYNSLRRGFAALSPLRIFQDRGLLFQSTQQPLLQSSDFVSEVKQVENGKCAAYCGYDPTSDSLHLGNLVSILMMGRLAQQGIQPIFLIGGATGMIGDPSGKSKQRNLISQTDLARNIQGVTSDITRSYHNILSILQSNQERYGQSSQLTQNFKVLNNADFYKDYNVISFLREVGKNFRVNSLLSKQSVSRRIGSDEGISFAQFSYGLLQAHDFHILNQKHGCVLQIGGSDQWGNITNGCEYIRRTSKKEVYAITIPLLVTPAGQKFGKSEGNALFLNSNKTPVSSIHQYLMNTPDQSVKYYLHLLTMLSNKQVEKVSEEHMKEPEKRKGQKVLCEQVHRILSAGETFQNPHEIFYKIEDFHKIDKQKLKADIMKLDNKDVFKVQKQQTLQFRDLIDCMSHVGLKKSKSELRREIDKGGIYLNNKKLTQETSSLDFRVLLEKELISGGYLILRLGKKHYKIIQIEL